MPPRKAKASASLADMVDSDADLDLAPPMGSDQENEPETLAKRGGKAAGKRGRPAKSKANHATTQPTKSTAGRGRAPLKEQQDRIAHSDEEDELEGDDERAPNARTEDMDMDEAEIPPKKQPGRKGRPPGKAKQKGPLAKVKVVENDGEFEYTPTKSIQADGGAYALHDAQEADIDMEDAADKPTRHVLGNQRNASNTRVGGRTQSMPRQGVSSVSGARHKTIESDTERGGDPTLRRKVGEMTRKLESMETKYRNLREIGIVEAEANYDRLKKQSEQRAKAANDLIESLRAELEMHKAVAQEARTQNSDLSEARRETAKHKSTIAELESAFSTLQTENRALQVKLSATRTAPQEPGKAPMSAARGKAVAGRGTTSANDDALQIAQLKEDLYSDLTGLIIRDVERQESQDTYDCIQTGRNGTLHFKLSILTDKEAASAYEDAEFAYEPRLDNNRDRELIDIMPEYLCEDITFSRNNSARFYSRIADTLTKRVVD